MPHRITPLLALGVVPLALLLGGWAVISVRDLPDSLTAGQPTVLTFKVRQHGVDPLGGLKPTVRVQSSSGTSDVAASATSTRGEYAATLPALAPGEATIGINSGFADSRLTLLPLPVTAAGARPSLTDAGRGRQLFVAKGCVTCHTHGGAGTARFNDMGPDLTGKHYPPDSLAAILAKGVNRGDGKQMPDLELKPAEIASLTAFINSDQKATRE